MSLSNGHRGSKTTVLTFLFANLLFTAHSQYGGICNFGFGVPICPATCMHSGMRGRALEMVARSSGRPHLAWLMTVARVRSSSTSSYHIHRGGITNIALFESPGEAESRRDSFGSADTTEILSSAAEEPPSKKRAHFWNCTSQAALVLAGSAPLMLFLLRRSWQHSGHPQSRPNLSPDLMIHAFTIHDNLSEVGTSNACKWYSNWHGCWSLAAVLAPIEGTNLEG